MHAKGFRITGAAVTREYIRRKNDEKCAQQNARVTGAKRRITICRVYGGDGGLSQCEQGHFGAI
jgi:hypothetical protein